MSRRIVMSVFSLGTLSLLLFLSTCQGKKSADSKKEVSVSKSAVKGSLGDYKTGDKFDPKKLFPDLNPDPVKYPLPTDLKGNAKNGKKVFSNTKTGNCAACHCTEHAVGCGNIGVSLLKYRSALGSNKKIKTDDWLFQVIADKRFITKSTVMPPSLPTKILTKQEILDVVAYLNTLK